MEEKRNSIPELEIEKITYLFLVGFGAFFNFLSTILSFRKSFSLSMGKVDLISPNWLMEIEKPSRSLCNFGFSDFFFLLTIH